MMLATNCDAQAVLGVVLIVVAIFFTWAIFHGPDR